MQNVCFRNATFGSRVRVCVHHVGGCALQDCLQNFLALPPDGALALLLAGWPLCAARRELQDYLVLLLRKVMFSRDVGARWEEEGGRENCYEEK